MMNIFFSFVDDLINFKDGFIWVFVSDGKDRWTLI